MWSPQTPVSCYTTRVMLTIGINVAYWKLCWIVGFDFLLAGPTSLKNAVVSSCCSPVLKYPDKLINSTITRYIVIKATEQPVPSSTGNNSPEHVRVVLLFKDQPQLIFFARNWKTIARKLTPPSDPFSSATKLSQTWNYVKSSRWVVNQQCLVYHFKCDLCDAGYVGFTRRHLHQRVEEHKSVSSSIGKHFRAEHSLASKDLNKNFKILKKCKNKFDYLIYETFSIHEPRPTLNVQSHSIRAKVFK